MPVFIDPKDGDFRHTRDPIDLAHGMCHHLVFCGTYVNKLFVDSFFCVSNIYSDYLGTLYV